MNPIPSPLQPPDPSAVRHQNTLCQQKLTDARPCALCGPARPRSTTGAPRAPASASESGEARPREEALVEGSRRRVRRAAGEPFASRRAPARWTPVPPQVTPRRRWAPASQSLNLVRTTFSIHEKSSPIASSTGRGQVRAIRFPTLSTWHPGTALALQMLDSPRASRPRSTPSSRCSAATPAPRRCVRAASRSNDADCQLLGAVLLAQGQEPRRQGDRRPLLVGIRGQMLARHITSTSSGFIIVLCGPSPGRPAASCEGPGCTLPSWRPP